MGLCRRFLSVQNSVESTRGVSLKSKQYFTTGPRDAARSITFEKGWVLLYFSSHAIAHWLVGWVVGIRFLFYTVGGTGNPQGWPPGIRWIFERLPFFGVQTEKLSMQNVWSQSPYVVRRCNLLGHSDLRRVLGLALRRSLEWVVFSVCSVLGFGNVGEQLDKSYQRLRQGATRPRTFLTLEGIASSDCSTLERIDPTEQRSVLCATKLTSTRGWLTR